MRTVGLLRVWATLAYEGWSLLAGERWRRPLLCRYATARRTVVSRLHRFEGRGDFGAE